jgi:hypothetical protein
MFRFKRGGAPLALALLFLAGPAAAQTTGRPIVHVPSQGMSSADLLLFGLNSWDRTILGARARAMGGAFLAMPGDASSGASNPAAVSWISAPQLASESRYRSSSASGVSAPATLLAPGFGALPISNYRPGGGTSYTYNDLSFAMPLVLVGRPAGLALTYRRLIDFKGGEVTRFKVQSPQGEADFGQGSDFTGGVDALTPAIAWNLSSRISFGAALNFMNGTIKETGNQGVTSFGFVVARGGLNFEQDVYGTSLDLGTRISLTDNLALGGVVQTGHKLKFRNGHDSIQPLPDVNAGPTSPIYVLERSLLDHEMSVPTKYGVGLSYALLNQRLTLAADYWNRAWSRSEITENSFDVVGLFQDSLSIFPDSVKFVPGTGVVTKNSGFADTHHFRFGAEWLIKKSENGGMQIPLRLGFRREPFTFTNMDTTSYDEAYNRLLAAAAGPGDAAQRQAAVMAELENIYRNGSNILSGTDVSASTLTAGTGISVGAFSAEFAIARTSYTIERVFLGAFADFTRNPDLNPAREDRSSTEFTFTTSLKF